MNMQVFCCHAAQMARYDKSSLEQELTIHISCTLALPKRQLKAEPQQWNLHAMVAKISGLLVLGLIRGNHNLR